MGRKKPIQKVLLKDEIQKCMEILDLSYIKTKLQEPSLPLHYQGLLLRTLQNSINHRSGLFIMQKNSNIKRELKTSLVDNTISKHLGIKESPTTQNISQTRDPKDIPILAKKFVIR